MEHPDRGLLTPQKFIEVPEKAGLIYKLDHYMWGKGLLKNYQSGKSRMGEISYICEYLNKRFFMIDVYETFTRLIRKYDINPENLKLEITETALMSDFERIWKS